MNVLVDTSILSMAYRRSALSIEERVIVEEFKSLLLDLRVVIIGPIRQELLSGIRDSAQFSRLIQQLRFLEDGPLTTPHFEIAAKFSNTLRSKGIQSSYVDALICAYANSENIPIFTTDQDFILYSTVIPIQLYSLPDIS